MATIKTEFEANAELQLKGMLVERASQEIDRLFQVRNVPVVDTNRMWKERLQHDLTEVLEAEAKLEARAPNLRAQFNARLQSFVATQQAPFVEKRQVPFVSASDKFYRLIASTPTFNMPPRATEPAKRSEGLSRSEAVTTMTRLQSAIPAVPEQEQPLNRAAMDEQKFLQRIGMLSNLNVTAQEKKLHNGLTFYDRNRNEMAPKAHSLYCDVCSTRETIDSRVIVSRLIDDPTLVAFCKAHRHDANVSDGMNLDNDGRKFKEL